MSDEKTGEVVEETATETTETTESAETLGDSIASAADASGKSDESTDSEETTAKESEESGDSDDGQQSEEATGAPESYSDFEVPEGFAWSEDDAKGWSEVFKGLNVSQEDAQGLVSKMTDHVVERVIPDLIAEQESAQAEQDAKWLEEVKDNQYLGGDGPDDLKASIDMVGSYVALVSNSKEMKGSGLGEDVIATLKELGVFSHPKVMAFFKAAAEKTLPDTLDSPGDGGMSDDWDKKPAHEKMDWDDDALPIRKAAS